MLAIYEEENININFFPKYLDQEREGEKTAP